MAISDFELRDNPSDYAFSDAVSANFDLDGNAFNPEVAVKARGARATFLRFPVGVTN
jgi:hypothetical protein